ncbi:YihD family protein [Vibrio tritonius]|uniref:YihD family protein n=1 Tax=Vibrio tritonius TaxID=1435069 RepID=A0ABS7YPM9_9VIBR|nr:YihD family protein [Vibrio tritonius]MCA2017621.1 YihD family protein [Vibrio tritonius]
MTCHRVEELLELLESEWDKESEMNLIQFLIKLAGEAGFKQPIEELTDDVLIYHLKMRNSDKTEAIPGLKKDYEEDFKTAILRARGIID